MAETQSIIDEAGEAVLRHRHVDTRSCQHRIGLEFMKADCPVCRYDARDVAAAAIRAAVSRLRDAGLTDAADLLAAVVAESGGNVETDLPEPEPGSEAAYWKAQTKHARAERDALALRLLQMATGWERIGPTLRTEAVVDAVRNTVASRTGGDRA